MAKIKILYVENIYDNYNESQLLHAELPWEEISDDELKLLTKNKDLIPRFLGFEPKLVIWSPDAVPPSLAQIKASVAERAKKKTEALEAAERRRQEKAALKEKKDAAAKRKLLAQLKAELGE